MTKHLLAAVITLLFAVPASASENRANDYLKTLSPKGQAQQLSKVVGEGCIGKTAFYMGSGDDPHAEHANDIPSIAGNEHNAFWSVRCTNGKSFAVMVRPDGNGRVIECPLLEAMHGGHCFKRFPTK